MAQYTQTARVFYPPPSKVGDRSGPAGMRSLGKVAEQTEEFDCFCSGLSLREDSVYGGGLAGYFTSFVFPQDLLNSPMGKQCENNAYISATTAALFYVIRSVLVN